MFFLSQAQNASKKAAPEKQDDVLAIPIIDLPDDLPLQGPITYAALRKHSDRFVINVQPDEMGQLIVQNVFPRNIEADQDEQVKKKKKFW